MANDSNEIKQKKIFLNRYRKNVAKIKRLENKIDRLDERLLNYHAIAIGSKPRSTIAITKAEILNDKVEYENRLISLKELSKKYKKSITDTIDELEDAKHIEVLESFFIELLDFDEIAETVGYTKRYTITLYSQAIEKISLNVQ